MNAETPRPHILEASSLDIFRTGLDPAVLNHDLKALPEDEFYNNPLSCVSLVCVFYYIGACFVDSKFDVFDILARHAVHLRHGCGHSPYHGEVSRIRGNRDRSIFLHPGSLFPDELDHCEIVGPVGSYRKILHIINYALEESFFRGIHLHKFYDGIETNPLALPVLCVKDPIGQ